MSETDFHGEIKVASRIIDYLSSGLYHNPAACLKELINNAYDADASVVKMYVKPDANRIIIEDNGTGMSKTEFTSHFDRISESHKRDTGDSTPLGRKKVGKIGIGFIAANEICNRMEVYSTKKGSTELIRVSINFEAMRMPADQRKKNGDTFVKGDYEGEILEAEIDEHYTQLFLEDIRGEAKNILASADSSAKGKALSLYGADLEVAFEILDSGKIKNWEQFDFYSKTMLQIALNIPVNYYDGWIDYNIVTPNIEKMEKIAKNLDFAVYYDGTELRKPTVIPFASECIAQDFQFSGSEVSAFGYFYAKHGTITPQDIHGLLLRIRNAAVGEYDANFLGFPKNEFQIIQQWVTCEIWADDRLEDAMNIDRRTLREVHPAYVELRNAFHKSLRDFLIKARKELYEEPSISRKLEKAEEAQQRIENSASVAGFSDSTVIQEITKSILPDRSEMSAKKSIASLKKIESFEVYDLVIRASSGLIKKNTVEKLIKRIEQLLAEGSK